MKSKRRSKIKNAALIKKYNPRIRQEKIDADYLHKLNPDELAWYAKFMEEENNASFQNDGTDFNQTKEERKKIYDRNNAANRCLYGNLKNKANKFNNKKLLNYDNIISEVENELSKEINPNQMENAYLDFIEEKELSVMMKEYETAMSQFIEISEDLVPLLSEMPESPESSEP